MTDTTTITPEEKASWRERLENPFSCHDSKHGAFTLRLIDALEAAEKALLKEEVYSEELESQLQDAESEYNANWAVQAISDVARLVGVYEQCSATGDDIGAATLEAVQDLKAENARLTAALNWFREREVNVFGFVAPCQCEDDYFEGEEFAPCGENADAACPRYNHRGCGHCWVEHAEREAARRAVSQEKEGWTPEHDDEHDPEDLEMAAACYAMPPEHRGAKVVPHSYGLCTRYDDGNCVVPLGESKVPALWPWDGEWWKPSTRERDLEKAGALLAAALDLRMRLAVAGEVRE